MISSDIIRQKFLDFFKEKNHAVIRSASLIPENDPTVLFTTAGMHPLVPYLMGEKHPQGKRIVNYQKCVRTQDIDEVGDNWHLTCFEMLGNWSLGDYFKNDMIPWSFEFLTSEKWLGIPKEKLCVTCFEGNMDAPKDEEAAELWRILGIPAHKIIFLPKADNWWGPAGMTGPCGPDSEMFYYTGEGIPSKESNPDTDKGNWVEIWNDVFMQYEKTAQGLFVPLSQQNVDTGMGLERITASLNGYPNAYETDLLKPIFDQVKEMGESVHDLTRDDIRSCRIITDHVRAAVFMLSEDQGISPSNVDQGYVLRRLIRRSVRELRKLGVEGNQLVTIAKTVVNRFKGIYFEIERNEKRIYDELEREETKFKQTLEKGLQHAEREMKGDMAVVGTLPGKIAFDLYQTYGFPLEMTVEIAKEKGLEVDTTEFEKFLKEHQELSRKGAEQKFKGGLADHSEATTKLHTATHLLNEALRQVISPEIHQKGSNITAERLRFDFNYPEKLTPEQIKKVEDWVNEKIEEKLEVKMDMMSLDEAKKLGAQMEFEGKYDSQVKVYTVWNPQTKKVVSRELCGGPHVKNTQELGHFKISKEESVAAGVRRIKAIVE